MAVHKCSQNELHWQIVSSIMFPEKIFPAVLLPVTLLPSIAAAGYGSPAICRKSFAGNKTESRILCRFALQVFRKLGGNPFFRHTGKTETERQISICTASYRKQTG